MIPSSRKRAVFVETDNTFSFGKNKATDAVYLREVSGIAADFQIDDGFKIGELNDIIFKRNNSRSMTRERTA